MTKDSRKISRSSGPGEAVCKPIEQVTLDHFRTHRTTDGQKRRAPLFWLNWPVNDINHGRLMMGKGVQLKTDVNPEDLAGAVTKPDAGIRSIETGDLRSCGL